MNQNGFKKTDKSWIKKKLQVIKSGHKKEVLVKGQQYMSWQSGDEAAERLAIVQIYKLGLGTQEELAKAFQTHINSVAKYINTFKTDGVKGLISQPRGPKKRWKIVPEMRGKILMAVLNEGIKEYGKIQEQIKKQWNKEVSIESIRQVLMENGFIRGRVKPIKVEERNLFEEKTGQLELETFEDRTAEKDCVKEDENNNENDLSYDSLMDSNKENISNYSRAQRIYLDRQERGEYSAYAGGLLLVPLLKRYNFAPTIERIIKIKTNEGYNLRELCLTLLYFDIFGFSSIENFKTVYPEEFGILIGKMNSPSILTLRRFLHKVRELNKGEELMEEFGKEYLKKGLVKWEVLYIDGQFLPYNGMQAIKMGWYTTRNIPLKGGYNFMSIDNDYNPFLFLIRPSSEDLLDKIPEIIIKAKKIAKETGDDEKDLTVIFDREGYSAELFRKLSDKKEETHAQFISWAKYADKWVNDYKEEEFKNSVMVKYKIQKDEEVKYFETKRVMNKYGKMRAIVIQSGSKKQRTAIYTNDEERKAEEIIQLMCVRWGQENLNKALKVNHCIEYFPGKGLYESEEMEEQPMVENPVVKKLKQDKATLVSKLNKLKVAIADKILKMGEEKINWDYIKREKVELLSEIVGIESKITLINREIDKIPKEIRFEEAHDGARLFELDYEKKRFIDCIKIFAYHIQKQLCSLLSNYYDKEKEIWPAMEMIVKRGANVKIEQGKLTVRLKRFQNPEIDYAARHLCQDLNQMNPVTLDRFKLPIRYEVS